MGLGGSFAPLAERQFRLLWFGRVSSSAGDALIGVALAFGVLSVNRSPTALGVVLAAFTVPRIMFTLVGGVVADRLPRRAVMLTCDGVRAVVEVFTAAMLLSHNMTLTLFCVTAGLFGTASAFFGPASTGLVPQTVSAGRLQSANALIGISQSATSVFGPAVSGALCATAGPAWVFAIDAASFVVSAFFLVRLRVPPRVRAEPRYFLAELSAGLHEVTSRSWVWTCLFGFSITNLGFAAFLVLGPVIAREDLGGARDWGWIVASGALGAVVGGLVALRVRPRRPLVAGMSGWVLLALGIAALAKPLPVAGIAAAYAVGMAGIAFGSAIWQATLQARIPAELLSRVSSYDWLVSLVFMPVGFLAWGPLAVSVGRRETLFFAAAAVGLANVAVVLSPGVRAVIAREEEPEPAITAQAS